MLVSSAIIPAHGGILSRPGRISSMGAMWRLCHGRTNPWVCEFSVLFFEPCR